jgi:large conductance mechanosensitive channel
LRAVAWGMLRGAAKGATESKKRQPGKRTRHHAELIANTPDGYYSPTGATCDKRQSMIKEFLGFLKHYGVVGLAIAVVLGGKLNELVSSLVSDLLMPLVFQPALRAAQVDDIRKLSWNGVFYGKVLGAALDFLIVALVVFLVAKFLLREATVTKK